MTIASVNVESVGHLSARCNAPLSRITKAVAALGIAPALVVDDVPHLTEDDAQRVAEHIAGQRHRPEGKR